MAVALALSPFAAAAAAPVPTPLGVQNPVGRVDHRPPARSRSRTTKAANFMSLAMTSPAMESSSRATTSGLAELSLHLALGNNKCPTSVSSR